mgnify:CR=1 FL=1
MKISIEIDLTPQEARSLLGMPNITAIQDVFVGMAKDKLEKTSNLVDVEPMVKTWTGLGGGACQCSLKSCVNRSSASNQHRQKFSGQRFRY